MLAKNDQQNGLQLIAESLKELRDLEKEKQRDINKAEQRYKDDVQKAEDKFAQLPGKGVEEQIETLTRRKEALANELQTLSITLPEPETTPDAGDSDDANRDPKEAMTASTTSLSDLLDEADGLVESAKAIKPQIGSKQQELKETKDRLRKLRELDEQRKAIYREPTTGEWIARLAGVLFAMSAAFPYAYMCRSSILGGSLGCDIEFIEPLFPIFAGTIIIGATFMSHSRLGIIMSLMYILLSILAIVSVVFFAFVVNPFFDSFSPRIGFFMWCISIIMLWFARSTRARTIKERKEALQYAESKM